MDSQTYAILQEIVRRESRSLPAYIADAYPWTTAAGGQALATMYEAIQDETEAVSALGRYLMRQRAPLPFLGSFPVSFTSSNFVALEYLLPRLVQAEKELIAALEADLRRLGPGDARTQVEALLVVKRRVLAALAGLLAPAAASGVA
jgi:hypothetical protein